MITVIIKNVDFVTLIRSASSVDVSDCDVCNYLCRGGNVVALVGRSVCLLPGLLKILWINCICAVFVCIGLGARNSQLDFGVIWV